HANFAQVGARVSAGGQTGVAGGGGAERVYTESAMARDYYPLIARAVAGLKHNTADARQIVYEHARRVLRELVRDHQPALLAWERRRKVEYPPAPDEPRATFSMIHTWRRWLNYTGLNSAPVVFCYLGYQAASVCSVLNGQSPAQHLTDDS